MKIMKKLLQLIMLSLICIACEHSNNDIDHNLIPVKVGERFGYINSKGEYVINPQFKDADAFRDGLARVQNMEGNYGFINKDGIYVVQPEYKEATGFYEGTAWVVKSNGYPKAIRIDGKCFLEVKEVYKVCVFSEGLALFSKRCQDGVRRYGFMDEKGDIVIDATFVNATAFRGGLAAVQDKNGKFGYIDKKGKLVIDYNFTNADIFRDNGQAMVELNHQKGTIDKTGKLVINPQFALMGVSFNNMYVIKISSNGDYGFCDEKGKIVINPQFEGCTPFYHAGLAGVLINGKWGYINREGKIVINPQFEGASSFFGDYAIVSDGTKYGLINTHGEYIVSPQFDYISKDFFNIDFPLENCVSSYYLNIERISQEIEKLLVDNKLDGMDFPPTVGAALQKYYKEEKDVPIYRPWMVKEWYLDEDVKGKLSMEGFFFNEVSDGWWGTESVLNKHAIAENIVLDIELSGNLSGSSYILSEELQKKFNGICGGFSIGITEEGINHVYITISK